jgi:hypothetical protein
MVSLPLAVPTKVYVVSGHGGVYKKITRGDSEQYDKSVLLDAIYQSGDNFALGCFVPFGTKADEAPLLDPDRNKELKK